MKNFISLFVIGILCPQIMNAQTVTPLEVAPNSTIEVKGDLKDGNIIEDLSWAWSSSNACFPETQKQKFTGNHVLYTTDLPKYSEMEIRVIPDDPKANFSLYAYEVGAAGDLAVVPDLPRCIRCEVDHKWDRPKRGKTQDHTRVVTDILAINNPYRVVIGVVGAEGLLEGGFTLEVNLKTR
ncbi:MAG: hypothetical protein AAF598_02155 [Bacteroidota bacterium]